jgi:cytochrome c5
VTKGSILLLTLMFALALGACAPGNASNGDAIHIPDIVVPGDPLAGAGLYEATCSNCHGRDLKGVDGLGDAVSPNEFVAHASEDELVELIIIGRGPDHPDNTTGIAMLPRGGNPSLGDQSIHDIAAYLKAHN